MRIYAQSGANKPRGQKQENNACQPGVHFSCFVLYEIKLECEFLRKVSIQLVNLHTNLLHGVTVTDGHCAICLRLKVIGHAERRTNLILAAISLTDVTSVVKLTVILLAKLREDLLRALVQLLGQRQHADLHRCQCRMEMKHGTHVAALQLLLVVGCAQERQNHAVRAQ